MAVLHDLRFAARTLLKYPAFSATALLTLGLGIGATTAIFSIVNAVLMQALPYSAPDRVAAVYGTDTDGRFPVSEVEYVRYREQDDVFASVAAYTTGSVTLTGSGDAELVPAAFANADLFTTLGRGAAVGRTFTAAEDGEGSPAFVVLSDALFRRRFGGTDDILGSSIRVNGTSAVIIGVLPPDFRLPTDYVQDAAELVFPLGLSATPDPRNLHYLNVVARLAEGITLDQARNAMTRVSAQLREELGTLPPSFAAAVVPIRQELVGEVEATLLALLAAVVLVLLIASVNVANLMLARGEARTREMAIRTALGAGRRRLARLLLTESVVLGLVGGLVGVLLAAWVVQAVVALNPPGLPRVGEVGIDARVIAFAIFVSLVTSAIFGLAPAWQSARFPAHTSLRDGGWGPTGGTRGQRMRRGLVIAEIALGLVLTIGATLVIRSFVRLQSVESGITVERVMTGRTALPNGRYPSQQATRDFYVAVLSRIRELPGIVTAGAVSHLPLGNTPGDWGVRIEGREEERLPSGRRPWADWIVVTPGYFEALGIELRAGRFPDERDHDANAPVVVINETMAEQYWPDGSAVGSRFKLSSDIDPVYRTVIGVVADVRHHGLTADFRPQMFLPHGQFPANTDVIISNLSLSIRTVGEPSSIVRAVRGAVRAVDPEVPLTQVRTMTDVVAASTSVRRLNVWLFTGFGILALALVSVGVYGVVAYSVSRRTRELGIRIALGASPQRVRGEIVQQGITMAAVGVGVGLLGAFALTRLLAGLLFGVSALDPVTFIAVPVLLTIIAATASYLPARRATVIDPSSTLREP